MVARRHKGVERWVISSVLRSKIRTERTERAKDFFVCGDEIQRCGGPSILENRHNGQAKAPSTGGRR